MIKRITYEVDDAFCDKCGEDLKSYLGHGICIYDKATYSNGVITAYRKWGRGYKVDTERIFEDA